MAPKKYFEKHHPRKDLFNGRPILFKSLENYILADFIDKRNLKAWLKKTDRKTSLKYITDKLISYCKIKNMIYAPSEAIIKSISCLPSISVFEEVSGIPFHKFCIQNGIACKFNYDSPFDLQGEEVKQVVTDSREQRPIAFDNVRLVNIGLSYGDYSLSPASKNVVERKSLNDFFSTFGKNNYDRFQREFQRAKDDKGYIVVLVESTYNNLVYGKWRWGRANPEWIFHRVREVYKSFDNWQLVFADGRTEMKRLIPIILGLKDKVRDLDLQFLYQKGIL